MKETFAAVCLTLTACTSTQVHWDAVQMRENVIDYYNDEIMDNLIRARNSQPFVHVDVGSLQALTTSELAGAVGGGQTLNNTDTRAVTDQIVRTNTSGAMASRMVAGTVGIVDTAAHLAMRPFTVSVAPKRSDSLTINSIPAIGVEGIYCLYSKFLNLCDSKNDPQSAKRKSTGDFRYLEYCGTVRSACTREEQLRLPSCVPGTSKRRGGCLYYVPWSYRERYLTLCRDLLIQTRSNKALLVPSGPSLIAP